MVVYENDINLTYAGARYLDPEIGQWLSIDPLAGKFPEWSPYNYTMGNPLNLIDPDGMAADSIVAHYKPIGNDRLNHISIHRVNEETGEVTNIAEGMPTNRFKSLNKSSLGWGKLIKSQPTNINDPGFTERIDIPEGMTEEYFEEEIKSAFKSYNNDIAYEAIPYPGYGNTAILPGSPNGAPVRLPGNTGNSNSLVGSVLRKAGSNFNPSMRVPGWDVNIFNLKDD